MDTDLKHSPLLEGRLEAGSFSGEEIYFGNKTRNKLKSAK